MPCYFPVQASFSLREDGKKDVSFSQAKAELFYKKDLISFTSDSMMVPCGRCIGCRLDKSRQWAVRMMHEAMMHDDSCFVTLTFDDEHLLKECPSGSLSKRHVQLFMKRLRQYFSGRTIRFYACGEYGEQLQRPHYHLCLFGVDFQDKTLQSVKDDRRYYTSQILFTLWPYGFNVVSDLTFDSAAYVARYCMKKVTGVPAKDHYGDREPEFALMSRRPGIGMPWLEKYGKTDAWTHDEVIVQGHACKPPRFYDKKLESIDPARFAAFKEARRKRAAEKATDNCFSRLQVKEKISKSRFKRLAREYETV